MSDDSVDRDVTARVEPITTEMIASELRDAVARFPRVPMRSALFRFVAPYLMKLRKAPPMPGVAVEVRKVPAVRVYRPDLVRSTGALLWIHGGGYVIGTAAMDDGLCARIARELGIIVISVEYRLAPRHTFPAPLDDCHHAWLWLLSEATALGIDPARIAIGGMSAGAGLAAAMAQRVSDDDGPRPAGQLLFAPMIDDRTAARRELDARRHPIWDNGLNRFGWRSYLGVEPGTIDLPDYASPARRRDLSGLAPAWIGVGSIELFHDEDLDYAKRLAAAGVPVTLEVVPGAAHGFELLGENTTLTRTHMAKALAWLGEQVG